MKPNPFKIPLRPENRPKAKPRRARSGPATTQSEKSVLEAFQERFTGLIPTRKIGVSVEGESSSKSHSTQSTELIPNNEKGVTAMTREQLTEKILDIKRSKGWSWKSITDEIGGISPVLVVGALLGQQKLVKPLAKKAAALFGLDENEMKLLNEVPMRGIQMPPTDPLIYRFYELIMVNGPAWKALIEEEFGDGIMSAIDFDFDMERQPDEKGDRVRISMSGKFLPYKYYGAEQGIQSLGFKEEVDW